MEEKRVWGVHIKMNCRPVFLYRLKAEMVISKKQQFSH